MRALRLLACAWLAGVLFAAPALAAFADGFAEYGDVGPVKAPGVGAATVLVVPLEIAGGAELSAADLAAVNRFFTAADALDSFENYWRINSLDNFTPKPILAPLVTLDELPAYLQKYADGIIDPASPDALDAALRLTADVLRQVKSAGFDFSTADENGLDAAPDGWLDGLIVITRDALAPVAFPFAAAAQLAAFGDNVVFDGVAPGPVAFATPEPAEIVRRFALCLGFLDLSDTSGGSYGAAFTALNRNEAPALIDPYSRFLAGWLSLEEANGGGFWLIPPAIDAGYAVRLGAGAEFFVVENRAPRDRYDSGVGSPGLAIYHVDQAAFPAPASFTSLAPDALNCAECDPWRPLIMTVQADGLFELQRPGGAPDPDDLFRTGDALLPREAPPLGVEAQYLNTNFYDGSASGVGLFAIDSFHFQPDILVYLYAPSATAETTAPASEEFSDHFGCSTAPAIETTRARSDGLLDLFWLMAAAGVWALPKWNRRRANKRAARPRYGLGY